MVKDVKTALIIAPVIFPVGGDMRYQGIERLVYLWASGLSTKGIKTAIVAARGSRTPPGVELIEVPPGDFVQGEYLAYHIYNPELPRFDVILDFSHSHQAMSDQRWPAMGWIWHDPGQMQPVLPRCNILALSLWQWRRLRTYQGIDARVFDPHCGTAPVECKDAVGNYFVFIGRAHPSKGMLQAAMFCQEVGVGLKIVGALGPGDDTSYLDQVKSVCHGNIEYLGSVSDDVKNYLLATALGVLHPLLPGYVEAHSHKAVDALLYGCPVISYDTGAMHEVVVHEVDGYLAKDAEEFKHYMTLVSSLDRDTIQSRAHQRWSVENTVDRVLPLMAAVADRLRWGA